GDPDFTGLLNVTGVRQQAWSNSILETVRKARTLLDDNGEVPTAWVLNSKDAEAIDLLREQAEGAFLLGSAERLFGPGVVRVTSPSMPQGTAVVGDFRQVTLAVRQSGHVLA